MKSMLPVPRLWLLLFTLLLANTRIFAQANDAVATLTIRTPVTGDAFTAPAAIRIGLVAIDPNGDIRHVEFFANGQSIGRSDQWTKDAVIPGKPREHFLDWTNVVAAEYKIVAKATNTLGNAVESSPVAIKVLKSVVVSIEATVPTTSEPSPLIRVIPGKFTLTRTGEAKDELAVFLNVSGTATPDKDYTALPVRVVFPAGQSSVALQVNALDDDLVEPDESVIATLTYPPLANPLPPAYSINPDKSAAKVVIHDPDNIDRATLVITLPHAGENFPFGTPITINATAIDPRGYIARVEFYDFEQKIGVSEIAFFRAPDPGTPIYHSFDWKGAAVGKHSLTARALDSSGVKVVSAPVDITVAGSDETPVVSIRFVPSPTMEPWPNADFAPGSVEISRTGSTAEPLLVFFELGGTATAGVDYKAISPTVLMGAGESSAFIKVSAIDDTLPEGDETVTFALTRPVPGVDYKDPTNYQIDPEHRTASITILDNDSAPPPRQVVLSIEARDASASESGINGVLDPAVFVVKRVGGPNDVAVVAQYTLSGTAMNGVDYSELSGHVELPSGTMSAEIVIKPIVDKAIEGEESVVIQLQPPICPAIFPPLPSCYLIADPASARATIKDSSLTVGPRVVITTPADGSVFRLGQPIEIVASATDLDGSANTAGNITRLDILVDGTLLNSTKLPRISMVWSNATAGAHTITAKASDLQGLEGHSEPVRIMVLDGDAGSFVKRTLPAGYLPGYVFTVRLAAQPSDGVSAYTIEEKPPQGWTVNAISNDGVFDNTTGKVKYGLYLDATPRSLSYDVLVPANASGRYEFSGSASANGKAYPVAGDRVIDGQDSLHPADANADSAISQTELTAYAAAWKSGATWARGPVPVPLTYVTRAGMLWRRGETYSFDVTQGAPPLCWVSRQPQPMVAIASTPSTSERTITGPQSPGSPFGVTISVTPGTLTSAFALAEQLPRNWTVSNISGEGRFDAQTSSIRWGLYLGDTPGKVTYSILPPAGVASVCRLTGSVSFDGTVQEIGGPNQVVASGTDTELMLPGVEKGSSGNITLQLSGPVGQVCVLEVSTDLVTWDQLDMVFLADGLLSFDQPVAQTQRYYRLRVQ